MKRIILLTTALVATSGTVMSRSPRNAFDELNKVWEQLSQFSHNAEREFSSYMFNDGEMLDISEDPGKNQLIVKASLPGYTKDEIDISTDEESESMSKTLTISASQKQKHDEESTQDDEEGIIHHQKASWTTRNVNQSTKLPSTADLNGIKASFTNGILTVTIPLLKKKPKNLKKIIIE